MKSIYKQTFDAIEPTDEIKQDTINKLINYKNSSLTADDAVSNVKVSLKEEKKPKTYNRKRLFALSSAGAFLIAITFGILAITGVLFPTPNDPGPNPVAGLEYKLIAGQKAYEVSIGTSTERNIVIASEYNNLPVKQIAKDGFSDTKIESVFMPDSITLIDTDGELERGAFYGCANLTSVVLSKNITSIGNYVFYGCANLEKIIIPDSVKSIGVGAFGNCPKLLTITIPDSVTRIGLGAFSGTLWYQNQPDGIVYAGKILYIYKGAMPYNKTVINDIFIDTVGIASGAFKDCINLTRITIPENVVYIGNSAFLNCIYLKSAEIPKSVTSIGYSAFERCLSLESIIIPNGVKSIESYTFSGCSSLTKVEIPYSVTSIKSAAFMGCFSLENIIIPNSIKSIEWRAFMDCLKLKSILIPNGVEYIFEEAFRNCAGLKTIIIPNSVVYIGWDVFRGCTSNADKGLTIYMRAASIPLGLNNPDLWNPEGCPIELNYKDA